MLVLNEDPLGPEFFSDVIRQIPFFFFTRLIPAFEQFLNLGIRIVIKDIK